MLPFEVPSLRICDGACVCVCVRCKKNLMHDWNMLKKTLVDSSR